MKKICILGSEGMLGKELVNNFIYKYKVLGIDKIITKNEKIQFYCLDLLKFEQLEKIFQIEKPDVIINVVAIVNLDICERNFELAKKLHWDLSRFISDYCQKTECKYIYISTDSIFDGKIGNYKECDLPNPINNYAKTKYLGEQEALKTPNSIIVRTNIYGYSNNQNSLLKWGYDSLKNGIKIKGFTNVIFNPVSVKQLSDAIDILLKKEFKGIINIGSNLNLSKYEFLMIIEKFLQLEQRVEKSELNDNYSFLKRPKITTLNTEKMKEILEKEYNCENGIYYILKEVEK